MLGASPITVRHSITETGKTQNREVPPRMRGKNRQNIPLSGLGLLFGHDQVDGTVSLCRQFGDLVDHGIGFAAAGTAKTGRIEYSDEYRFLEDERVYIVKAYANGMPKDNNSFLYLDISGLKPASYKVTLVNEG